MDPSYSRKIQEWVRCDNQLLRVKEETANYLEKKKELETEIVDYVQGNGMKNLTINISDGVIKFATTNSKAPLSRKTLKSSLESYSSTVKKLDDIDAIINYVYDNIETNTKTFIKRDVKNMS
jgi:hypothetical protein